MNPVVLENLLRVYTPGCRLVIPQPGKRCHTFNNFEPDQTIPNDVLPAQFFRLGLSLPLHPFIQDILDFYNIAPLQLNPNSYRMAICMYILYDLVFEAPLSARELGYFYQLKETGKTTGFFYLTIWNIHKGNASRETRRECPIGIDSSCIVMTVQLIAQTSTPPLVSHSFKKLISLFAHRSFVGI